MSKMQANKNFFRAYQAVQAGCDLKRAAKDGSIPTHPTVPCPDLPEAKVLEDCLGWFKRRRIYAKRMNVGAGQLAGTDRFHTYGVPGMGDILAILPGGLYAEIECKAGKGGRWSEKQQKHCKEVLTAGGTYVLIHGVPELEAWYSWRIE